MPIKAPNIYEVQSRMRGEIEHAVQRGDLILPLSSLVVERALGGRQHVQFNLWAAHNANQGAVREPIQPDRLAEIGSSLVASIVATQNRRYEYRLAEQVAAETGESDFSDMNEAPISAATVRLVSSNDAELAAA